MNSLSHDDWMQMNALILQMHKAYIPGDLVRAMRGTLRRLVEGDLSLEFAEGGPRPASKGFDWGPFRVAGIPESRYPRLRHIQEILQPHLDHIWPRLAPLRRLETAPLTRRQREVLPLVLRGLSNKEIAARLGISVRTAEKHLGAVRILLKL